MELLVVMGIMGLLGTVSVGGYRAMKRSMEERGVMQNVNTFIRSAYQRAQIDRQPVAVFFWNETLRFRGDKENEIVVGKAVAVRRAGRLSRTIGGNLLVDEFGDLDRIYQTDEEESGSSNESTTYLYPMNKLADIVSAKQIRRSLVYTRVTDATEGVVFLSGSKADDGSAYPGQVPAWAFEIKDRGGVEWKAGMAYGFEFQNLTLPHNFIFGSDYSSSSGEGPVKEAGAMVFDVGVNKGDGLSKGGVYGSRDTVEVYSLRQSGADLEPKSVATSDKPDKDM